MLRSLFICLPALMFTQAACAADGVGKLKYFIAHTRSAQAFFTQEVLDKKGKSTHPATGVMQFLRPGKFRWTYQKPYEQIIVGDGMKFWMYDVDLNQVTIKKLDTALGSSPAALLAGSHEIERDFTLSNVECERIEAAGRGAASQVAGEQKPACTAEDAKLEWLEARPKSPDSIFASVRMAFNAKSELAVMELRDTFGHVTVLRFTEMRINPMLPVQLFQFDMPDGVEILEDRP